MDKAGSEDLALFGDLHPVRSEANRSQYPHRIHRSDDLQSVQLARELYAKDYQLLPTEMKEWYHDACEVSDDVTRQKALLAFYKTVLSECTTTTLLWVKYLEFLKEALEEDNSGTSEISEQNFETALREGLALKQYDFCDSDSLWIIAYEFYTKTSLYDDIERIRIIKSLFHERLRTPHRSISETFSAYSSFISKFFNSNYDNEMIEANKIYSKTFASQQDIESFELTKASYKSKGEFWLAYFDFISGRPKKLQNYKILEAIIQRAVIEFDHPSVWMRFLGILYNFKAPDSSIKFWANSFLKHHRHHSALAYSEYFRSLDPIDYESFQYSRKMLQDADLMTFSPYGEFKLLVSSMLSYELRLVLENAEVGHIEQLYKDCEFYLEKSLQAKDVYHTVERLITQIFEAMEDFSSARDTHRKLTSAFPSEAENWLIAHYFEKRRGDYKAARTILLAAINRATQLDWAERIFDEAVVYESAYGTRDSYNQIISKIDTKRLEISKSVFSSSEEEPKESQTQALEESVQESSIPTSGKRMLEEETSEDTDLKKPKLESLRDREHLRVVVRNVPFSATGKTIGQFFRDCGSLKSCELIEEASSKQAIVEFYDEASVLKALTKDKKPISGSEVEVVRANDSTVWIANFPPSYLENDIRLLFEHIGTIAGVRFPSLKFNSQRRFCYVDFLNSKNAQQAVDEFNDTDLEGYKVIVKISDPASKLSRTGPAEEGREIFVSKLDYYKVTALKVKKLFEKYGTVEKVHLPLSANNMSSGKKHDGYGFVTFSSAEQARSSLDLNMVNFEGRIIQVSIAEKKSKKERKREMKGMHELKNSGSVVALEGLPDFINPSQIKAVCEEVGPVKNVILEPDYSGAIIEFENAGDTGLVTLKLSGRSINGYKLKFTTLQQLEKHKLSQITKSSELGSSLVPTSLRRHRGTTSMSSSSNDKSDSNIVKPKTNSDFRNLFLKKK